MDAARPMMLKTAGEVAAYNAELFNIIQDYHVHFLRIGHHCKQAGQREGLDFIRQGNHPSIRVISVHPETLDAVGAVHRVYAHGKQPCTMCPVCGETTL